MQGNQKTSKGLARRPLQQGAGRDKWCRQAYPDPAYWLTKKQRKHRKLQPKKKKRLPPQNQQNHRKVKLNIFQANVAGIKNKTTELKKLFHDNNIHVALLQETQHQSCNFNISGYVPHTCRCTACRGIITYIRKDLQADVAIHSDDSPNDILKATVWFGDKKFQIFNVYSAPKNVFTFTCQEVIFKSTIVAGDFNGHSPLWGYADRNPSGINIEDLCQSTNLIRLQDEFSKPTLLHKAHGTLHRPDLTLVSPDIHSTCCTEVLKGIGSDHLPILISIDMGKQPSQRKRSRWNFKKANWQKFRRELDTDLDIPTITRLDENEGNDYITKAILKAAKSSIPRGSVKKYSPFWTKELENAVTERHAARNMYESENSKENRTRYNKATAETKLLTKKLKKQAWTEKCGELNLRQGGRDAWKLLGNMSGANSQVNPKPFTAGSEVLTSDTKKAEHLNKHFAKVTKATKKTELDRTLKKALQEEEFKLDKTPGIFSEELTNGELDKALKMLKMRKAPGPVKVHNEMLKNLGETAKTALLILFNKTWKSGVVPKAWKLATISPILKKGKPADLPQSYRPISKTSSIGKVAERIVNKRLYWWLESTGVISQSQAGFRAKSRTEDQLFRFTQKVLDGFQEQKHTTAIFIDLQQAYDRVWKTGLYQKMQSLGIKSNLYSWVKAFLTDRLIQTQFNASISSKEMQEEGLPQGSSLSCTLFLIFINDVSDILQSDNALFADDLVLWHTSNSAIISRRRLQEDLQRLEDFCSYWKLKVNENKTVYSIFTKSHKVANLKLNFTINNRSLDKDKNPTYLGVTLDCHMTLNKHLDNIYKKADRRLNLIKHLASSNWGADKNTLRSLYLAYTRSIIDYNIVLQNMCSKSAKQKIDKIQNQALRLICGGMRSSPTAACEISANIEPLELRRKKAALDLYERAKRLEPSHPCRKLVERWKGISRLQQKSVLHVAKDLSNHHFLPSSREELQRVNKQVPPHKEMKSPSIKKHLLGRETKSTDPTILRLSALETVDSYPKDWIHVYTDGSAFKATINAGYGAIIHQPDGSQTELFNSCGSFCSNYVAEKEAITQAITHIHDMFDDHPNLVRDIVIFTDSQSALQALENGQSGDKSLSRLTMKFDQLMSKHETQITLQWIPGHAGIGGNEKADTLAKKGASMPQPENSVPYETAVKMIKSNFKEQWLQDWTRNNTGRALYEHMNAPKPNDPVNKLKRGEQSTIFRLRTGHIGLNNHLSRIKKNFPSQCPLCLHPNETVEHHLLQCPELHDLRRQFLPAEPSIFNCLYGCQEQLEKTCKYFYHASSPRATAQRLLVR